MRLILRQGDTKTREDFIHQLVVMQYKRNDMDFLRGTFRVRGDTIDIFPAEHAEIAVRIELFDDEVDAVVLFDPLTGRILQKVPRFVVYPASHYVTPRSEIVRAMTTIKEELKERLTQLHAEGKEVEAARLQQRTLFDLEMLDQVGFCKGIENYSRHLTGLAPGEAPPCLIDYLPKDAVMFFDESHVMMGQLGGMYKGDHSRKETLVMYGFRLPSALDNRPLRFDEFERKMRRSVFVSATPAAWELSKSSQIVEQVVRPTGLVDPEVEVRPATTQVDDVLSEIIERTKAGDRVLVTTLTKRMAEELTEYLLNNNVRCNYIHSDVDTLERVKIMDDLRQGIYDVLIGVNLLREGLDLPEVSLVAILDADKEGFLRSRRSLTQTAGRAARNVNGKVIMYADTITESMQKTNKTRPTDAEQYSCNTTKSTTSLHAKSEKAIKGILTPTGGESEMQPESKPVEKNIKYRPYIEPEKDAIAADPIIKRMSRKQLEKSIADTTALMKQAAKNLDFLQAAQYRDEIVRLQSLLEKHTDKE